jgi:RimJ/RimL family protein N-acetyltransferase
MPHYKLVTGEKCYLSPLQAADAVEWAAWFNDLDVTLPLGDEAYSTTGFEVHQEDVLQIMRERSPVFSIVRLDTDELIGRCLLFGVNQVDRSAMLGILIGDKSCWNQGYGSEALILLLDYAFNLLNLNSVMLGVFAFNQRAAASYRKVGFQEIGRRRQARIVGGQAHDVILMDLLADEFRARHASRALDGRIAQALP